MMAKVELSKNCCSALVWVEAVAKTDGNVDSQGHILDVEEDVLDFRYLSSV